MVRIPNRTIYHGIALAEGANDSNPPAKTGVPQMRGTQATPAPADIPVDDKGPEPQSAPLPNADAPASQGLSVPQNQVADSAPGLSDIEFAELKSIFENLQKTSVTRGPDAKAVYKKVAKLAWAGFAAQISASQRAEFNKLPAIK